ncbi:helix-turn-helix domain-containing protein [Pseudomonas sp. WS 5532]|uniref:helix-turn-helix domain-containing protein n=1 Tax=unclassified Pseudomonas TaxID=196821 RepID=UPI001475D3B0|nr:MULTISPECIES: helix-turn-helix domain-containing protein [unclassified Pseudomonas]NMX72622.1 helix-turn-helix domain-containing protein [Pseudomonas sp. WS 5532]QXI58844.1 helix-turn-helix domain-containing protein [Pseudomonas sp. OE 28.3]
MNTATIERSQSAVKSLDEAKASLVQKFIARMNKVSESEVINAANLDDDKALAVIIKKTSKSSEKPLSIKARNEIAFAQMKSKAFEAVKSSYDLLDAGDACQILGISKQALSKKTKSGQLIAYTNNRRKYYPDFQFENNKATTSITKLLKALEIDPEDEPKVNLLIVFLANTMDYSNPGEPENVQPRYKLLDIDPAFQIIVRDFKNRLEMGK